MQEARFFHSLHDPHVHFEHAFWYNIKDSSFLCVLCASVVNNRPTFCSLTSVSCFLFSITYFLSPHFSLLTPYSCLLSSFHPLSTRIIMVSPVRIFRPFIKERAFCTLLSCASWVSITIGTDPFTSRPF